jgi:hypothetical protein
LQQLVDRQSLRELPSLSVDRERYHF